MQISSNLHLAGIVLGDMKNTLTLSIISAFLLLALLNVGCSKTDTNDAGFLGSIYTFPSLIEVTANSAQGAAGVTYAGSSTLTAEGFCWSATNKTPTISDSKASRNADTVNFVISMTGLSPNTTYYTRAFVTNSAGTAYSDVLTFKTKPATYMQTATVSTLAGNGTIGFLDGFGTAAQFNNPLSVCADSSGNVYVADTYNNVIRKITATGLTTTYAGNGSLGYVDGAAATAEFSGPQAITCDAQGNLYVTDNNRIRKISAAGTVSTLAGRLYTAPGYTDGTGTGAAFNNPTGIAVDNQGYVYVADRGNNVIRKISSAGVVTTLAGSTTAGHVDSTGTYAAFNAPYGIAVDGQGNVYVSDINNYALRKITSAGKVTTLTGSSGHKSILGIPTSLGVDGAGNVYISDSNGRILEFTTASVLYSLAGTSGSTGFVNGINTSALFNMPKGVTSDAKGNLFVSDFNNNAIRKIVVTRQ